MTLTEILARFQEVAQKPYQWLQHWKEENPRRKVVGCLPLYVPEEMLHAAGVLPVWVLGSEEPIVRAQTRVQPFYCGVARSIVEMAMKGDLDVLDGMVTQDTCLAIRALTDAVPRSALKLQWFHCLFFPVTLNSGRARAYLLEELRKFQASLEWFARENVTPQALRSSIQLYNQHRARMRRLYDLRRGNPYLISPGELSAVVAAGMVMPKEEHLPLLEELLAQLPGRPVAGDGRMPLVLSGNLCEPLPEELLQIIEEAGAVLADDDLYVGSRYFFTDIPPLEDPLEALAEAHLFHLPPCPTKINPEKPWGDYLVQLARGCGARGVISVVIKQCEPHDLIYPSVRRRLMEAGIPEMRLEVEHDTRALGQFRTRVQAFVEIMRQGGA